MQVTLPTISLPDAGFLRLDQIVGRKKKGEPPVRGLIPVSGATWWRWVREGKAPKPRKLGPMTTVWKRQDVLELIEKLGES